MSELNLDLIKKIAQLLDALGPFLPGATRADKWRTTDQLANELKLFESDAVSSLDQALREHKAQVVERINGGLPPDRLVRRAKYPDRTTVLPLWGSTKHLGQPWAGNRPDRNDPAEDLPSILVVPAGAPKVFLPHTHHDYNVALFLAEELASMSVGAWRFQTEIQQGGDIANSVREALGESDGLVALVTRSSIASLWVLTELHTSLQVQKTVILVVDANDTLLMELLESVRFSILNDQLFNPNVAYDTTILQLLKEEYGKHQPQSRAERYERQVHDFMATLSRYLSSITSNHHRVWRSMLAFPQPPAKWCGILLLESIHHLPTRLEKQPDPPLLPNNSRDQ